MESLYFAGNYLEFGYVLSSNFVLNLSYKARLDTVVIILVK